MTNFSDIQNMLSAAAKKVLSDQAIQAEFIEKAEIIVKDMAAIDYEADLPNALQSALVLILEYLCHFQYQGLSDQALKRYQDGWDKAQMICQNYRNKMPAATDLSRTGMILNLYGDE